MEKRRGADTSELALLDKIRERIRATPDARKDIPKKCNISSSTLSRFMAGGDLGFSTVEEIAAFLGERLTIGKPSKDIELYRSRMIQVQMPEASEFDILQPKLRAAKSIIQILTNHPGTRIQTYVGAICEAYDDATHAAPPRRIEVQILCASQNNPFLKDRRLQLGEQEGTYLTRLKSAIDLMQHCFADRAGCELRVYNGLPIQLWHRIDDMIFVNFPSIMRRSRDNCMLGIPVNLPGVKETFLDHFDRLWSDPDVVQETNLLKTNASENPEMPKAIKKPRNR